jgi:hypothetical protein
VHFVILHPPSLVRTEIIPDDSYQTVSDVSLGTLMWLNLITCYGMENYENYFKSVPGCICGFFRKQK